MSDQPANPPEDNAVPADQPSPKRAPVPPRDEPKRLDPTRYGDWEKNGRCIDF